MKINEFAQKLNIDLVAGDKESGKEVKNCYIGDLLSLVMSKAKANDAWITIQTNTNIVAVASLLDIACIILPEGLTPDANTIVKANEEGIAIFKSKKTAFELACEIGKIL